jgi:hypothetical protein
LPEVDPTFGAVAHLKGEAGGPSVAGDEPIEEESVQPLRVILVTPGDAPRRALEERIRRLGHDVLPPDAEGGERPPAAGDVVVADLRGTNATVGQAPWPGDDGRPILALVDESALPEGLLGRRSGVVIAVGDASGTGLEIALRVCVALRRDDPGADDRHAAEPTVGVEHRP